MRVPCRFMPHTLMYMCFGVKTYSSSVKRGVFRGSVQTKVQTEVGKGCNDRGLRAKVSAFPGVEHHRKASSGRHLRAFPWQTAGWICPFRFRARRDLVVIPRRSASSLVVSKGVSGVWAAIRSSRRM